MLDLLVHQNLRRFVIWYLPPRQDYFELIPSRSNNLQAARGLSWCALEHFPDQTGFFIGLNVFESVQDLPHDLQELQAITNVFAACVLVMKVAL